MRNFVINKSTPRIGLKWDERQSGIYCIFNRVNGKFYIGSSINCYKRVLTHHYGRLRQGKHTNPHLQSAWDKYGEESFESFIIEICHKDHLIDIEQLYIDGTKCLINGYNINPFADRTTLTEVQRNKIRLAFKGKPRDPAIIKKMLRGLKSWRKKIGPEEAKQVNQLRIEKLREAIKKRDEKIRRMPYKERVAFWLDRSRRISEGMRKRRKNL